MPRPRVTLSDGVIFDRANFTDHTFLFDHVESRGPIIVPKAEDSTRRIPLDRKTLQAKFIQLLLPTSSKTVVWTHGDSEIAVQPASLNLLLRPGLVLIELPVATDQTGSQKLLFAYNIGRNVTDAALTAVTEAQPRGDATLAARWGIPLQDMLWRALLAVGEAGLDRQVEKSLIVSGLFTDGKQLTFLYTKPFSAIDITTYLDSLSSEKESAVKTIRPLIDLKIKTPPLIDRSGHPLLPNPEPKEPEVKEPKTPSPTEPRPIDPGVFKPKEPEVTKPKEPIFVKPKEPEVTKPKEPKIIKSKDPDIFKPTEPSPPPNTPGIPSFPTRPGRPPIRRGGSTKIKK